MTLLCFGDSNTYGYDPRSFLGDRYPANVRWTDCLAELSGCTVLNVGMNGRTIPSRPLCMQPAALLLVMLGSNDLLQGQYADEVAASMEAFLQPLLSLYPQILLIAPPAMQRGTWVTADALIAESARLADEYRQLAQRLGIPFADAGAWDVSLTFDGVHFSEAGHRAFANGLYAFLKKLELL